MRTLWRNIALVGALVVAGSPADALELRGGNYTGMSCFKSGGNGVAGIMHGTIFNSSTTAELTVTCPMIKNWGYISDASFIAFDRNTGRRMSCTLFSQMAHSTWFITDSITAATPGPNENPRKVTLLSGGVLGDTSSSRYNYATCVIPRSEGPDFTSHLVQLRVHEWG